MITSLFPARGQWYKGNIHSHTTLSDGAVAPEDQIALYRGQWYDFLAFTDHNVMNDKAEWSDDGFLMLKGWERDILYENKVKCTHVIGLFPPECEKETFRRMPGDKHKMTDQDLIDEMRGENDFIVVAHPSWSRMEPSELLALSGFDAVEVFNTGCERLCHEGHGEYLWDLLLRNGHKVLGIACDDTHGHTEKDDHFGGWVMVKAESLTRKAVLSALKEGNYYSTQGPEIKDWGIEGNTVSIKCSPVSEIHFITYPARGKASYGDCLENLEYTLKGGEKYLRIEIIDEKGNKAWTNPLYL